MIPHRHRPAPRTAPIRAWLIGAMSACTALAAAWMAQHEPTRTLPERPATRVATLERAEEPAMVIRLKPAVPTGESCIRLRPARDYEAAFGGAAHGSAAGRAADVPSSVPDGGAPVAFSRAAVEDWPGQPGGDASQP